METTNRAWYELNHPDDIASPALMVFPARVEKNIERLIEVAGRIERLRPHVKTHKMAQVIALHQKHGIRKVKCATIAEAEMVASCGVPDVLLAYQPVGPNQQRMIALIQKFPATQFGCLVDNERTFQQLLAKAVDADVQLRLWIDIDNGMGRSGVRAGVSAENLIKRILDSANATFGGLHVYDGQFAKYPIDERIEQSNASFEAVRHMIARLAEEGVEIPNIVAGGSPTFPVHTLRNDVDLSPGTYVFWDAGYGSLCPELPFEPAALVLTRVISKLGETRVCVDLGSKSVSPDNPIENRVRFLNAKNAVFMGQSEEHLIVELPAGHGFEVGDVLYGVPWHICPTVALHQAAHIIDKNGVRVDEWSVVARDRVISV